MPYPNEHACRIKNPDNYERFARDNKKSPNVIFGVKPDGGSEVQAYRYPISGWDAARARSHCSRHNGSFEKATNTQAKEVWWINQLTLAESKWYLVVPFGVFDHPAYGKLDFNEAYIGELKKNYDEKVLGETRPFVDVNHDEGEAMGWINKLDVRDEGLYALVEWTPKGVELIKGGSYKYFSPWIGEYTNPQTGKTYKNVLRGGALTNVPFLKMLPPMELSEAGVACEVKLSELIAQEDQMDILKKLAKALGLEEDAKEEDVLTKIAEMQASEKSMSEKIEELNTSVEEFTKALQEAKDKEDEEGEKETELEEVNEKLTEALTSNKKLAEELHLIRKEREISKALQEGKLRPADRKDWELLFDENEEHTIKALEKLPVVVSLSQKSHQTDTKEEVIEEDEKKMAEELGMTLEEYRKYRDTKL